MSEDAVKALRRDINYFVCTLGQAAVLNAADPPPRLTLHEYLDQQAARIPDLPAVGFTLPPKNKEIDDSWTAEILSYGELQRVSIKVADELSKSLLPPPTTTDTQQCLPYYHSRTVAMLMPSSPEFLYLWLGLTRLGFATLQIAPQCQPEAIVHLCRTLNASVLFYDDQYQDLALQAASMYETEGSSDQPTLKIVPSSSVQQANSDPSISSSSSEPENYPYWPVKDTDTLFCQHTSGTSGKPTPLPQDSYQSIYVSAHLPGGSACPTFTTTPLYHGGLPDVFRSWATNAMIWLFSAKDMPITAANVIKSLQIAQNADRGDGYPAPPPPKYFASVPFVLQMVAAEEEGLELLKGMDAVGVGGAPLASHVGDDLVRRGIKLVSRFGSAECGFLLSSHRNYEEDLEWEYLRAEHGMEHITFESQGDGTFEMVVHPGWPRIAKVNRPDGSLATSDLFEPHPTIPNAWKYHSRADAQLALATGKKFDPSTIESMLCSLESVREAYVFGRDRPFLGALLFPHEAKAEMPPDEFIQMVWPAIEGMNARSQAHTRLAKRMFAVGHFDELPLPKSSKGTLLRGEVDKRFHDRIEALYELHNSQMNVEEQVPNEQVIGMVEDIVQSAIDREQAMDNDADLFLEGVDSVAAMQMRIMLQERLLPPASNPLPLNVVYDCGSIAKLAEYIINIRSGTTPQEYDDTQLMLDLVDQYSQFDKPEMMDNPVRESDRKGPLVVLTGATGALGAHILHQLRSSENMPQVICLVRAQDPSCASERVNESLIRRRKPRLDAAADRVLCLPAKLGEPYLGMSGDRYKRLARQATVIIHAAWAVNFSMRLGSFVKDHIGGLHNLLQLALSSTGSTPPLFLFCSSTASVVGPGGLSFIPESPSRDPTTASPLGYAKSKWVGEAICVRADEETALRGRINVLRIGQLCGDTQDGIWNVTEAWPLMLSSLSVTGALPDLDEIY
ncbi:MAG: putative NRPS-like protein biosynthetic cluster [Watsoniomyces obsoletus]|nr:MAG: putative NRPS-like protein biosynthetic cluster [Watsoniomyces obsoletus]